MNSSLTYSIGIIDDKIKTLYKGLDGGTSLTFNEIIAINPHNIEIIQVSLFKKSISKISYSIAIYYANLGKPCTRYALDNIEDILDHVDKKMVIYTIFTIDDRNEVLHLINLWLTKFVPNGIVQNEK